MNAFRTRAITAATAITLGLAASSALASDTSYVDACIDAVNEENGRSVRPGGKLISRQGSEAGTLIVLEDAGGTRWRCVSYADGTVGELTRLGGDAHRAPSNDTVRVTFYRGNEITERFRLGSSDAITYLVDGRSGEFLSVAMESSNPDVNFVIYVPDGDVLFESAQGGTAYRGELYENGEHRVELVYRGEGGTHAEGRLTFSRD